MKQGSHKRSQLIWYHFYKGSRITKYANSSQGFNAAVYGSGDLMDMGFLSWGGEQIMGLGIGGGIKHYKITKNHGTFYSIERMGLCIWIKYEYNFRCNLRYKRSGDRQCQHCFEVLWRRKTNWVITGDMGQGKNFF